MESLVECFNQCTNLRVWLMFIVECSIFGEQGRYFEQEL